jgi:hypothetical protein
MSQSGYVHLTVEKVVRETASAFLLVIEGEDYWIPKSQIADPETYEPGDEDLTISVTDWIAKQKGLEGE